MKKPIAIVAMLMLLVACTPVADDSDDVMMDDTSSSSSAMMDSDDDGTVEGTTNEDAGGDGSNTTGVDVEAEVSRPQDNTGPSRSVIIEASDWAFTPDVITAKKGEDVTIQVEGVSGTHGFAVPELGINFTVTPGESISVDLPTDKVGTFGGFCSVPCGSGHRDMQVTIIITE